VSAETSLRASDAALLALRRLVGGEEALQDVYSKARFQHGLLAGLGERDDLPSSLREALNSRGGYELALTASEQLGDWFDETAAWRAYEAGKALARRPSALRAGFDAEALELGQMIASVLIVAHDEGYEWSDAELSELADDARTIAADLSRLLGVQ
jgi:hypothetical protein